MPMDRHSGGGPPPHLRGRPVSGLEAAHANEYFDPFLNASTLKSILGYHRSMCEFLHLKPNVFPHFYPKLRANLTSWRAKAVWKKFDARASHKCYGKGKACAGTRVLIIGAGPCGMRTAIEAQLLGAKVVVVEKRDRLSRNNVLHLWPFVIEDLRMLGAKKFFGKFCAGAIDHISIRQLQCIMLKVALLLGVEVHTEVSFEKLVEPNASEKTGWRAEVKPENHPVSQYEFDVIIGADGKRNTLQGFKRKEFRGKLAIAITANFINKKTEAEARVEEISGVAFIFNQKFFKDLQGETRIDLENIVYYKDDTHYFVMTAKKASLLEKGVIKHDLADTEKLLAPENVDRDALQNYAREAADFSTNYLMPDLEFAVNHYGQPDVAMFDFTSMYAAEYASKVVEKNGNRLLMILVGDSLLEPFWPTGSGCARGFLSSLDAAWAIRSWASGQVTPLDVLAERESIYRLLAQTTPDNLNKDWKGYTLDPVTRYPNLNKTVVLPHQTICLYETDNPQSIEKMKRSSLEASRHDQVSKKRRRGNVDNEVLLNWLTEQLRNHKDITITDTASVFRGGKALCAIIHHYRPDLLDYSAIKDNGPDRCNQMAMDILEKDLGIPPFMTGEEITNSEDSLALATYLTQVYDTFRGEIPHIKHPKLRKKSPSKIPRILPKNPLPPELLRKLNMAERKISQTTIVSTNVKTITPNTEKRRKKKDSIDDLVMIEKERKSDKEKLKLKKRKVQSKPLTSLSEKTFFSDAIGGLKKVKNDAGLNKIEFFDVTYLEDCDATRKKRVKSRDRAKKGGGNDSEVKKVGKTIIRTSIVENPADKKIKKSKSKHLQLSESKVLTMKKKKLKFKNSNLSIIRENVEEKLSEKTRTLSHTKNTTPVSFDENFDMISLNSNEINNIDANNLIEEKNCYISEEQADAKFKKQNFNLLKKNNINVFHCQTFVHNEFFDTFDLPKVPSQKSLDKDEKQNCQNNVVFDRNLTHVEKSLSKQDVEMTFESDMVPARTRTNEKLDMSRRTIEKTKNKPKPVKNVFSLRHYSPLQLIRKHLFMKKAQIKSVVSKQTLLKHQISEQSCYRQPIAKPSDHLAKNILKFDRGMGDNNFCTHISQTPTRSMSRSKTDSQQSNSAESIKIHVIQKCSSTDMLTCQSIEFKSSLNVVKIISKGMMSQDVSRKLSKKVSFDNTVQEMVFLSDEDDSMTRTNSGGSRRIRRFDRRCSCQSETYRNRADSTYDYCRSNNSWCCNKNVEHIFVNKGNFLKNDDSSQLGKSENFASILGSSLNSPRLPSCSRLQRMRFPQFRGRTRHKNGKKVLPSTEQPCPILTPADAQIIKTLGINLTDVSNSNKKCHRRSQNRKNLHRSQNYRQKFPFERGDSIILKQEKFSSNRKMDVDDMDQTFNRVSSWISQHDFKAVGEEVRKDPEGETVVTYDIASDITSITRAMAKKKGEYDDIRVEERTDVIRCESPISSSEENFVELVKNLKEGKGLNLKDGKSPVKPVTKFSQYLPFAGGNMKAMSAPPTTFSVIVEGEESELPESNKRSEFSFKSIKTTHQPSIPTIQPSRPSSRHKRHAEPVQKPCSIDRKQRKRRTLEKIGPSVDHDTKVGGLKPQANTNADEDIASKIRSLEDKWTNPQYVEKKPKDLLRAIGKIETSDWNIKEIEKKILENKMGKPSSTNKDKERVPRWSKEEFRARQTKMEKKHLDRQDSQEAKYADIDKNIKHLELKLKEGTTRDLGQQKVASITEKLVSKVPQEKHSVEKSAQAKPVNLQLKNGSEFCHFCGKRVYLMERLSAEGRFFHHGCFKCQYCHTQLRLGSYTFDRDGQYGHRFFCIHHYGMQGELPIPVRVVRKPSQKGSREVSRSPQKKPLSGVAGVDLLDRVQTPERIEFSNLSTGNISSDHEEPLSQMDEDEWTDKNFGASCAELDDSDDNSSSSLSDTDSDDEDAYDDALEEPVTKEGTMKWAERWKNSYKKGRHSDTDGYSSSNHSSYYENSSDDSDSETATEGEEEIRARELRKQEVRVEPPVVQPDTGTDTEMVSDESSSDSSSEIHNSATEISTDSEFAQDDPTPTREAPSILLNDFHVTKTRGTGSKYPKKIQVTTGYIQRHLNERPKSKPHIELKLSPLVSSTPNFKKPAPVLLNRTEGYALNRTQSTGGIAAKVSLELKKKYLLGESGTNSIQKSGSASTLDTKFKSFQTTISDCQKLLKPAPEVSASMQMFCSKLDERHSPVLSPQSPRILDDREQELPPPDITITTITENKDEINEESEAEARSRSPVHEASIPVPSIDWSKQNHSQSSDSLSITSASENDGVTTPNFHFENIPRVEVHAAKESDKEDIPLDSLCPETHYRDFEKSEVMSGKSSIVSQETCKSITSGKKSLNQPKSLPNLESVLPDIHRALHVRVKSDKEESPEENKSVKTLSGKSSPEATAALTETELSDWARDENVSDSIELDMSHGSDKKKAPKIARIAEFDDPNLHHVCGKDSKEMVNKTIITEAMNNLLSANLDSIEYMDTGTETSSDDGVADSQNGYVLFKDEDDLAEDSLDPRINEILEAKNIYLTKKDEPVIGNSGFCILAQENNQFGGEVIDLKPSDLEILKQKQTLADHEEDSLLILETTGTTTEENTCSDSTVKNVTEIAADATETKEKQPLKIENFQRQRLEDKLAKVKEEQALLKEQKGKDKLANKKESIENNLKFEEHCQRLQSKVEFGSARDSMDVRKSRRKSKTESPQKPDIIQEEKERASPPKDITLNLSPVTRPDVLYKKENIKKERDVNQKLIQEMVMNKMKAENKSLERKKRNRNNASNLSPCRPYEVTKSMTTDILSRTNLDSTGSSTYATPDLLSNSIPLQNSQSVNTVPAVSSTDKYATPFWSGIRQNTRPLSVFSTLSEVKKLPDTPLTHPENFSLPDIRKQLFSDEFTTPTAPPRYNRQVDVAKTADKLKENARARARLLSNEDLGLSPEDKLNRLRDKVSKRGKEKENVDVHVQESIESLVLNTERRNSLLYSNDTLTKKKNNSFRRSKSGDSEIVGSYKSIEDNCDGKSISIRPKSISEIPKKLSMVNASSDKDGNKKICKSDPNLLDTNNAKLKKKGKDRERRKSITKLIANIFTKKSPMGNGTKGLFAKLSPKAKTMSKSLSSLELWQHEIVIEEPIKKKSLSEVNIQKRDPTPPPVPPLPTNYSIKDESSEGELLNDWKRQDRSSCDTLDQSGNLEASLSSLTGRRSGKARRVSRQAQLKRHRMAQEIQRKLEETEVKTRELEHRGVEVEKALRGEDSERAACSRDEPELLQEWFDLMRDRTELRRYEKELMVRAQELELEDRHARLQAELRERLETNENKTQEDVKTEESIIDEMMGIVAKRDSLISVLEEDRLRYSNEDKDMEEQMLAKGLMLTPIRKSPEK